ncbi:MAG: RluA family pseudouridine synthase [Rickettsiaceae bacterium]|nr:RluA family pseudouridine synthase [Rickettsiaceae bacterium]
MSNNIYFASKSLLPLRLDKLLSNMSGISRNQIIHLIKKGNVFVDDKLEIDTSKIIAEESIIVIKNNFVDHNKDIMPKAISLDVVYEDEDIIVINKQAGLTVHPGAGNYNDTLVNGLLYHCGKNLSSINTEERPGIVHRIDRDTSGLIVVAKNNFSHNILAKQISDRKAIRMYKCLVWGYPKDQSGSIITNIGRNRVDRQKMQVQKDFGKLAVTNYRTLEIYKNGLFSLVEAKLDTGRTHQIRVHMTHIGCSILGDQMYGANNKKIAQINDVYTREIVGALKRQALHAFKLSIIHPRKNERMDFERALPLDIASIINFLKN